MASKTVKLPSSGTYSYDSGKYKCRLVYSYSNNAFTWHVEVEITDAFKSGHYITIYWNNESGTEKNVKSSSTHKAKKTWTSSTRTFTGDALKVSVKVGGNTKRNFASQSPVFSVYAPSSVVATQQNDGLAIISVKGSATTTKPTNKLVLERSTDDGSFSTVTEDTTVRNASYTAEFRDNEITAGHRYRWRVKAVGSSEDSDYTYSGYITTRPTTNESVTVTPQGSSNLISWSINSLTDINTGVLHGWYVLRSTNGGVSYSTIATVYADTSRYNYSYTDSSLSSGQTYKYAIQAFGSGGGSYDKGEGGDEVSTAPSRPSKVEAYRGTGDNIIVKITDYNNTAEDVLIERSIDGGAYTQIASEDYPCDSYTDTTATGSDSIQYRVRNRNSVGYSGYTESGIVELKQVPNPPSLLYPYDDSVVALDDASVKFMWKHNPNDGTPQSKAQLQYKVNSGSFVTIQLNDESSYSMSIVSLSANDVITWKVRTKGAHNNYSNYSIEQTFTLRKKPEITLTSPENASVIEELPIVLEWDYSDLSGTLQDLTVDIIRDNEPEASYQVDVGSGTSGHYSYSLSRFLFENDSTYTIHIEALSSSGLNASDEVSVDILYEDVSLDGGLLPTVTTDEDTGVAYISIMRDITPDEDGDIPEPLEIAEAYLYRVHDRERELIGNDINEGAQIVDKYAPINCEYQYELLQLAESGEVSIVRISVEIESNKWFVYYGPNLDKIAAAVWEPTVETEFGMPEREYVQYSGKDYPNSYNSDAKSENANFTCVLNDRNDLNAFKEMMKKYGATGIWKSGDGDCFRADFTFKEAPNFKGNIKTWNCSLTVKRINKDDSIS